jgi:cyclopropane fatty-acyl-phospholipid synthase-like methyltransferase
MINEGVVDFHPSKRYDIIVSISTFEHIGLDEKPKDP